MDGTMRRVRGNLVTSAAVATLCGALLGAECSPRDPRAPYLCCILTCTGGLVTAEKGVPERADNGWVCVRGQPIPYDGSCSAEDGLECEDVGSSSSGGGPAGDAGASGGSDGGSSSSSTGG